MASRNTVPTSSRMGEMPEGQLLFRMAVPLMLSMLVQALYNVVDSIYVSAVSEDCLTALSLAFPVLQPVPESVLPRWFPAHWVVKIR